MYTNTIFIHTLFKIKYTQHIVMIYIKNKTNYYKRIKRNIYLKKEKKNML